MWRYARSLADSTVTESFIDWQTWPNVEYLHKGPYKSVEG